MAGVARAQTRAKSGQWITSLCWLERLEQIATVLEQNESNQGVYSWDR